MFRTSRLVLGAMALAVVLPATLAAQGHPNVAVGLSPESTYDSAGIDHIGLFSGSLSVGPIPLGPRYTVGQTFSYGLNAVYNNNLWEFFPVEGTPYVEARPSLQHNLGAGWTVTMGELWHPGYVYNPTDDWIFVDSSGGRHKLVQQMFAEGDDENEGVRYSRDNSFVRMTEQNGSSDWQLIETPDGLKRTFVKRGAPHRFRLEQIDDRFGNWVKIRYSEAGQLPDPPAPWDSQWRITDNRGRTHWVYLRHDLHWVGPTIDTIDFQGPNSQRLVWTFDYHDVTRRRSCKDTYPDNDGPQDNDRITMGLLVGINRPDGSKYEMLEGSQAAYYDLCPNNMYDLPGMLKRLTLPTGGWIEYDYQRFDFPGSGYPPNYYQSATGVKNRKTYDRDGSLIGTTTYYTARDTTEKEMVTRVVQPTGECSRHYFEAFPDPSPSSSEGWDYGLPYGRSRGAVGPSGAERYLSSEVWTNASGGECTGAKLRSTYVRFDHDPFPNLGSNPSNWYNTNRRLSATRTVFHDAGDKYIDTDLSGYDGVGHYRTTTTTSDNPFTPDHTVTTNFNPGRSAYTPWPVGVPWILGTFNYTLAEEPTALGDAPTFYDPQAEPPGAIGETSARVDYRFNTDTGALNCQRVRASGTSRSGDDIVTQYVRNGGYVTQVRTRGGDGAGLPTGSLCAGTGGAGANFTYAHGVLKTTRPVGTNGAQLGYLTYDADIDPGTGWVMATRDPSGLETSYSYDALGRVTQVTPQEGAWSSTTYTHGTGPGPAKIRTTVTGAGTTLSDAEVIFDGLGRQVQTRRRTPDHGWVSTDTTYDAAGRVLSRSLPGHPSKKVQYRNYDPFGRPGIIRPPEGSTHDVLMSYEGVFRVDRSVKMGTAQGEVYKTWIQQYDGLGRLRIVTEPGAIVGQETGETLRAGYGYDVAGRLTQVRTVDGANGIEQKRVFIYDNRGFLLSESHPELGPSGSPAGHTSYSGYDAQGNPSLVYHSSASPKLRFQYDPFGRLTYVRDPATNQVIKRFIYDTAVGRGEGKLAQAIRHNRITIPGGSAQNVKVTESYRYEGTAGAPSSRVTDIDHAGGLQFEEQYTYDAAGQLIGLGYPDCLHAGCGGGLPNRTVDLSHSLGHLREVGSFTSGPITYHPDGSWATIPHGNGVTDLREVQTGQTGNPGRTARLRSTGANSNYDSGFFSYDGAGHITQMGDHHFVYDAVGRLVEQNSYGSVKEWEYEYDAYGNLKSHTEYELGEFDERRTFAINVQKNQLASASYDWRGNLLNWGGGSYEFDEAGNLQSVGSNTVHIYTASDERIGTLHSSGAGFPLEETYTLRSPGGQILREVARDASMPLGKLNWNQDYVWRGGQLLSSIERRATGESTQHYTLNHLGSPMLTTLDGGASGAEFAHAPFGESTSPSGFSTLGPTGSVGFPLRFTGHERDFNESGELDDLDYMHARHYTPYVGRFLQVDPVLGSIGSPQSWNRYAYAGNDPVNFTDPRGRNKSECDDAGGSCPTANFAASTSVSSSFFGVYSGSSFISSSVWNTMVGLANMASDFYTSINTAASAMTSGSPGHSVAVGPKPAEIKPTPEETTETEETDGGGEDNGCIGASDEGVTILVGGGFSATPLGGVEGSIAGAYHNRLPSAGPLGQPPDAVLGSFGSSALWNISADVFAGVMRGNVANQQGTLNSATLSLPLMSITVFTGDHFFEGGTIGFGPTLSGFGLSGAQVRTRAFAPECQ